MQATWSSRRELARLAWRRLRGGELTPRRAALSVAAGLAIGMTPAYGLHWLLVLGVCLPLRLDTGVAYLAANISMPLVAPFLSFAEIEAGALLLRGHLLPLGPRDLEATGVGTLVKELAVGTAVLAPLVGAVGGAAAYAFAAWRRARHRDGEPHPAVRP
jgi:uncharacterized protein (DUF2062 family)